MKSISFINIYKRSVLITLGVVLSLAVMGTGLMETSAGSRSQAVQPAAGARVMRVVPVNAVRGQTVTVPIEWETDGDEVAVGFSIQYDQTILSSPTVVLGGGVPVGSALTINPNHTSNGRLGILMDSGFAFAAAPPAREVVRVTFNVAAGAPLGPTPITFGNAPIPQSASNPNGDLITSFFEGAMINVVDQAPQATYSISGRVTAPNGSPLRNAVVSIRDAAGATRTVLTSSFGQYSFENVATGQHTVSVGSKRFRFSPQVITVSDSNLTNVDFQAAQ